jgi:hypothetical protein
MPVTVRLPDRITKDKRKARPNPDARPPFCIYIMMALFMVSVCSCILVLASLADGG